MSSRVFSWGLAKITEECTSQLNWSEVIGLHAASCQGFHRSHEISKMGFLKQVELIEGIEEAGGKQENYFEQSNKNTNDVD